MQVMSESEIIIFQSDLSSKADVDLVVVAGCRVNCAQFMWPPRSGIV